MITGEQLLDVFATYNQQIWPMQLVAYLLGIGGILLALRQTAFSSRLVPGVLAFFWLWVAFLFWFPAGQQGFALGYILAAVFLVQGLLFLVQVFRPQMTFSFQSSPTAWGGVLITLYALVGYPLVGWLVGHVYPQAPPFGLTPCPLVVYTFGLLLFTRSRVPRSLLVLPMIYALVGFYWAAIGMVEDIGMALSGILGAGLILARDARLPTRPPAEPTAAPKTG